MIPVLFFILGIQMMSIRVARAQIYEPEGLNMPGAWNSWNNPPYNNLALASYTEVPGGRVVKFSTGQQRWQTIFSVAETGGDLVGGSWNWLFTSGPVGNPWGNKWASVNVVLNTLQLYTKEGATDNSITIGNGKWYTMNFEDAGYTDTRAIFMETSAQPVDIAAVSNTSPVMPASPCTVTMTLSLAPAPEELFYLRYTTDSWATSFVMAVPVVGTTGTVQIPGQNGGTTVSYYLFSSTVADITADYDLYTIKMNTNGGVNYTYTVTEPVPVITFANLQNPPTGTIELLQPFQVTGRAGVPGITGLPTPASGLEAWVGYSLSNSDPALWTNWIPATYSMPAGSNDEFTANLGASIGVTGTYYYATRYRLNSGAYVYGGYSPTGGGFWTGIDNVAGVLDVQAPVVPIFLTLENTTVAAEESHCYNAKNTITVAGNGTSFTVQNGGSATLIAGVAIDFLPGSVISNGGYLHGYITSTGEYCSPVVAPFKLTGTTSGTEPDAGNACSFRIYPNPAATATVIQLQGVSGYATSIFDLYGIRGNHISTHRMTGPGSLRIDLESLQPGAYLVRMISGDNVQTRMLVRQ